MPSKLITGPSTEPISLAEAKAHLRVDADDEDDLILGLITSARQQAEQICRRAFIIQKWMVTLDHFPISGMNNCGEIILQYAPLISVDSITYVNSDGATQTLATSLYKVDNISEPARIMPAYGTTWPATRNEINAVQITLTAGWENASSVPQPIKSWMLLRIAAMYENRESDTVIDRGVMDSLPFVDQLLAPYRVIKF